MPPPPFTPPGNTYADNLPGSGHGQPASVPNAIAAGAGTPVPFPTLARTRGRLARHCRGGRRFSAGNHRSRGSRKSEFRHGGHQTRSAGGESHERGNLESASNLTLRCFVESPTGTSILSIVEEGTQVERDQVVVELDSSRLRDESVAQQIRVDAADAALKIAVANSEIQKKQNESDIAAADLKLQLARLDLQKYRDGEYPQSTTLVVAEIDLARESLDRAVSRLGFTRSLLRKGFTTTKILDADRVGVRKAEIDFAVAGEKRRVLDRFAHRREMAEREANVELFEQELERVKLRAEAALSQRERNLLAAKRTYFIESERQQKLLRQIAACTIRTPREGLVVYSNGEGGAGPAGPRFTKGRWCGNGKR